MLVTLKVLSLSKLDVYTSGVFHGWPVCISLTVYCGLTCLLVASTNLQHHLPFPHPQPRHTVFFRVQFFLDPHLSAIMQYLSLSLPYLTEHDVLKVHPHCCKWQDFLLSCGWIVFHCIYRPHLPYPVIHWWAFRLFLTWLSWVTSRWTWTCRHLLGSMFSSPLDVHPEVWLLGCMVVLFLMLFIYFWPHMWLTGS